MDVMCEIVEPNRHHVLCVSAESTRLEGRRGRHQPLLAALAREEYAEPMHMTLRMGCFKEIIVELEGAS